jgi:D-arabinose 1-dehydrogenase-like Zn-dependent alcohol dehydrogenase
MRGTARALVRGTARALVLDAPRRLELRTLPLPDITDDDGLVRVEACGVCGTDHEQYIGELGSGFAFVPGHETVGVIEAIGPRAAQRWSLATGDRVAVEVFKSCRKCEACVAGEYRHCERQGIGDMCGFLPVDRAPGLWGGYAEYQYLAPDSMVLPVQGARRIRSGRCAGPSRRYRRRHRHPRIGQRRSRFLAGHRCLQGAAHHRGARCGRDCLPRSS